MDDYLVGIDKLTASELREKLLRVCNELKDTKEQCKALRDLYTETDSSCRIFKQKISEQGIDPDDLCPASPTLRNAAQGKGVGKGNRCPYCDRPMGTELIAAETLTATVREKDAEIVRLKESIENMRLLHEENIRDLVARAQIQGAKLLEADSLLSQSNRVHSDADINTLSPEEMREKLRSIQTVNDNLIKSVASRHDSVTNLINAKESAMAGLDGLRMTATSLSGEVNKLQDAGQAADDEVIELKKSLSDKTSALSRMIKILAVKERTINKLRDSLGSGKLLGDEKYQPEIDALNNEIKKLREQVQTCTEVERPALRRRIANLADTIDELQRQLETEGGDNAVFKRSAAGPIDTSEELREAKERIKLIERLIAESPNNENNEDFEGARKELLGRIAELTKSESDYQEKLRDMQRQLADKADKVRQLSEELDRRPTGEDEKARLRYLEHLVASQERAANAPIDDASRERIRQLQEQVNAKTREIDDLVNRSNLELKEKEDRICENMSKIMSLNEELERAKSAAVDANARIRYLEHLYATLSDLTTTAAGANLEERIRALNVDNQQKEEDLDTLTSKLRTNDDRLRDLEQKLLQEQRGKEQLREQLSNLQDEYEDLSKQLRMKEAEIEDKIMQINTLSPQLDEARYRIKRLEKEYTDLKSTHIHSSELDPYRQQLTEKNIKIDELNRELQLLQERQATGEQAHSDLMRDFKELTDTAEKRDKELIEKDLTIDRLLDAIRVQEDSFTKLRTSIICMEDEHRISEMASQQQKECLEELTKAREELEAQVQSLMKGVDQARTGETEARKYVEEVMQNSRKLCDKLNREIEDLTEQLNSRSNVDPAVLTMLKEAQQRIKTLEARPLIPEEVERELTALREQLTTSEKDLIDARELERRLKELEQLLEERDKEIEELKREIKEKNSRIQELEYRIAAAQSTIDNLTTLTNEAAQKIKIMEHELCAQFVGGASYVDIRDLERAIEELRQYHGEALDKLLKTKADSAGDQEELSRLRSMSDSDEIMRLRERLDLKEKEVATIRPLLEEAQARMRIFESDYAEKESKLVRTQEELNNIRSDLANAKEELNRLRNNQHDNVDTAHEYNLQVLRDTVGSLTNKLDEKEKEVETLKEQLADADTLQSELKSKEERIRLLEEDLRTRSPSLVSDTARDSTALGTQLELLEQNRKLKEEIDNLMTRVREAESVSTALRAAGNAGKNVSEELARKDAELQQLRASLAEAQKRLASVEAAYARYHSANDKDAEIKTLTETLAQQSQAMAALREANMAKDREIDELNDALIYQERTVSSLCMSLSPKLAAKSPMRSVVGPMSPPMQPVMSTDAANEIANLRAALERANDTISSLEKANTSTNKQVKDLQSTMESKEKECEKLLATIKSMSRDETINAPDEGISSEGAGADPAELAAIKKDFEIAKKELERLKLLHHYRSRADEGALEDVLDKDMQIQELLAIVSQLNKSNEALERANTAKDKELMSLKDARFYNENEMTSMREQSVSQTGEVKSMEASLKDSEHTIMGLCAALSPEQTAKAYLRDLDEVDPSLYAILKAECMRLKQCLDFSNLPPDAKEAEFKAMLEQMDRLQAELLRKDDALKNNQGDGRDSAYVKSLEDRLKEYEEAGSNIPSAVREKLASVKQQMTEWFRDRPDKSMAPSLLEIFD